MRIAATVAIGVMALLFVASIVVIGRGRFQTARAELGYRLRTGVPFLAVLGAVLLFNAQVRTAAHDLSWAIGWRITPRIRSIEGETVILLQSAFGEPFAWFFSFMYVYGYVFLLVFPLIAYFLLEKLDIFKALTVAYAANYAIGLVCYILFVAYGPRNAFEVWEPLYQTVHPQFHLLTSVVNQNTNVFPSLHTSLSATVMLFAWRTREDYPIWLIVASFFGISIIVSTMYLAIHWAIDAVFGLVLAYVAYRIGLRAVENEWAARVTPGPLRERLARLTR